MSKTRLCSLIPANIINYDILGMLRHMIMCVFFACFILCIAASPMALHCVVAFSTFVQLCQFLSAEAKSLGPKPN